MAEYAWTPPHSPYPPYVNVCEVGDEVRITVRASATDVDGVRVCGVTCRPGNEHCNNYCNQHPDRSLPMPDHPRSHRFAKCGDTISAVMPRAEFERIARNFLEGA